MTYKFCEHCDVSYNKVCFDIAARMRAGFVIDRDYLFKAYPFHNAEIIIFYWLKHNSVSISDKGIVLLYGVQKAEAD